jgi:hypothetical protein
MADDEDQTPGINRLAREVQDWEYVSQGLRSYTQRKAVPGGWIYRTVVEQHPAMCFVPTPPPVNEALTASEIAERDKEMDQPNHGHA